MNNKIIPFIIFVFCLFQIQGFGQADTAKIDKSYSVIMRSVMISQTLGEWNVNATFSEKMVSDSISEENVIICNVCPVITFRDQFNATLQKNSDQQELYTWEISSDTLHLEYVGDSQMEHFFSDSKYKMVFIDQQTYLELKLYTSETSGYILRKENKR